MVIRSVCRTTLTASDSTGRNNLNTGISSDAASLRRVATEGWTAPRFDLADRGGADSDLAGERGDGHPPLLALARTALPRSAESCLTPARAVSSAIDGLLAHLQAQQEHRDQGAPDRTSVGSATASAARGSRSRQRSGSRLACRAAPGAINATGTDVHKQDHRDRTIPAAVIVVVFFVAILVAALIWLAAS